MTQNASSGTNQPYRITVSQEESLNSPFIEANEEQGDDVNRERNQVGVFEDRSPTSPLAPVAGISRIERNTPLGVVYRLFQSFPFQLIMLFVTIIDVCFLLYEFITGSVQYSTVTLCTSLSFFVELLVVVGFDGFKKHFLYDTRWLVAEAVIVTASFIVEYVEYVVEAEMPESDLTGKLRYFRAIRFFRVIILVRTRYRKLVSSLRRLVSADRRRYVEDGFDLDLTYVHDHVIAMSWPSSKAESLYRNKIGTVAAFLDMKHPDCYHVFNLCSERSYDENKFHNYCTRVMLDDHNPTEVLAMLKFAQMVAAFIAKNPKSNVAVIHCKGGKGRTGTMVCSYLMYSGIKPKAVDALAHFGRTRTADEAKSFQGVESPSQDRYVRYFEKLLASPQLQPPPRRVRIARMLIRNLPIAWWANGVDRLWFVIILKPASERNVVYKSNPTTTFDPFPIVKGPQFYSPSASPPRSPGEATGANNTAGANTSPRRKSKMVMAGSPNVSDNEEDGSPAAGGDTCQPFGGNYVISVGDKPDVPLDCYTFEQEYVVGPGNESLNTAASAVNFLASSARLGAPHRNLNKELVVNVEVNTSSIPPLENDVQVKFFHNVDNPDALHSKAQFWFHCSFEGDRLELSRCQIDGPHKEGSKPKKFPRDFGVELDFETL